MDEEKIRLVFGPSATIMSVVDIAWGNGWKEVKRFRRSERQLEEVIFELEGKTSVRGITDHFVGVVFASIDGPQREYAAEKLRQSEDYVDRETLWQWAKEGTPAQQSFALRAFAATSGSSASPIPEIVALYEQAFESENAQVRKALIEAVGRVAWSVLWPLVDKLAASQQQDALDLKVAYGKHLPKS
jgi:hypothetical protein